MFIVGVSLDRGVLGGIVASLGITLASLVQLAGATLGITILLEATPGAFSAITYLGAGYLIYLGIRRLRQKPQKTLGEIPHESLQTPYLKLFTQGFVVNLMNPKGWLFLAAFIPQFINPGAGSPSVQMAILGLIFVITGTVTDAVYAFAAGSVRKLFSHRKAFNAVQTYLSGGIFIALGVMLIVMDLAG